MLPLPLLHPFHRKQEVRIFLRVVGHVQHARRPNEFLGIDLVYAVFRQVLAAYPMDGSVKVRACMFAGLKAVPVPSRAAIVIPGNLPQLELRGVRPLRRQRQKRRLRAERLGQVHHAQFARVELCNQLNENIGHSNRVLVAFLNFPALRSLTAKPVEFAWD